MSQQPRKHIEFVGTCVHLQAQDLDAYDESERQITYGTFARHLGAQAMKDLESAMGYTDSL